MVDKLFCVLIFLYVWYMVACCILRSIHKGAKKLNRESEEDFRKEFPFSDKSYFIKSLRIPFYAFVMFIKNLFKD